MNTAYVFFVVELALPEKPFVAGFAPVERMAVKLGPAALLPAVQLA